MKRSRGIALASLVVASLGFVQSPARGEEATDRLREVARNAVTTDCTRSRLTAIAELRSAGPAGLEALFAVHAAAIEAHRQNPQAEVPHWDRISAALNAVGSQHDCHASRLYWHTDLDQAKAAAKASGKPILSLRMLGNLTEECSCANSRFFRTTLYPNEQVSKILREQFVLHWKSVRPVPKVTIDFGDGRKLERTLTGNSIHYVLDADGRVVEAIPGLYGPQVFLRQLEAGRQLVAAMVSLPAEQRENYLRGQHASRRTEAVAAWIADLEQAGVTIPPRAFVAGTATSTTPPAAPARPAFPTAAEAARLAVGKGAVEVRVIDAVTMRMFAATTTPTTEMEKATTDEAWQKIAARHAEDAKLDRASLGLIREHNPTALRAAEVAKTKRLVEDPLLRMVRNLQNSIALDTVRNEYLYHTRIHEWFAAGEPVTRGVEELNKRIYAELFLTPDADPWLGLVDETVYTGIRNGGVRQ